MSNNVGKKNVKIVGIGGCGVNILNRLPDNAHNDAEGAFAGAELVAVTTNHFRQLTLASHVIRFLKGENIHQELAGATEVIAIVGLGGSEGTSGTLKLVEAAHELGVRILVIATIPFEHEGSQRKELASVAKSELESKADELVIINQDDLRRQFERNATMNVILEGVDKIIIEKVQEIFRETARQEYKV
jgi:cell division protein FtsZ